MDKMKIGFITKWCSCFIIIFFFNSCGVSGINPSDDSAMNFYVESVETETLTESSGMKFIIQFSHPVLSESVTNDTVFIVNRDLLDEDLNDDWNALYKKVSSGDVESVVSDFSWLQNDKLILNLTESQADGTYELYVVPRVQSTEYWPLDQKKKAGLISEFRLLFKISQLTISIAEPEMETENFEGSSESDSSSTNQNPEAAMQDYPSVLTGGISQDDHANLTPDIDVNVPIEEQESNETESHETPFDWSRVLLTEVVTDPQQDFGESALGNAIPFDAVVGTGTVGSTDEYLEIFNGSSENLDLTGWTIQMNDGTDELQGISEDMDLYFSGGGAVTNFQSGELLVVGNPQGSINNTLSVFLYNEQSELIDSVDVEDGNATSLEDEAVFRDSQGDWEQGVATPGSF